MRPDRQRLHERASAVVRQLVQRFGTAIPEDAETIVRYYVSCQNAYERAAEAVIQMDRSGTSSGEGADDASQRAAEQALAACMAAGARAASFDEGTVALLLGWLPLRRPDSPFRIATDRIELELVGGVHLVLRRSP